MENIDTCFGKLQENLTSLNKLTKQMNDDLRSLQKNIRTLDRTKNKNRSKKPQPQHNVDSKLLTFLGRSEGELMTRAEVMKEISGYVKSNNLQLEADKKRFKPNSQLCKLFNITAKSVGKSGMTFVEINKYITQYLTKV